jgi:hypothetical protein
MILGQSHPGSHPLLSDPLAKVTLRVKGIDRKGGIILSTLVAFHLAFCEGLKATLAVHFRFDFGIAY